MSAQTLHAAGILDRSRPTGLSLHPFRGIRRSQHALARDHEPAFYILEQRRGAALLQRGMIGTLDLTTSQRAILPHEHVIADKVALQRRIIRLAGGNPEPLLLACHGADDAHEVMAQITGRRPDTTVEAPDGIRHSLWRCADVGHQRVIAADFGVRSALIADGHHRYAAALKHRRRFGGRCGPWDRILALVVDTRRHPLHLGAIHRHLPDLASHEAAARAAAVATVEEVCPRTHLQPHPGELILLGDDRRWSVTAPRTGEVRAALAGHPEAWQSLDAAVLHHLFIDRVWRTQSGSHKVSYLPDLTHAPTTGTLALLAPPREDDVRRLAEGGTRMPQKSTSFGPKPLPWLVTYHHGFQTRGSVEE
ncbi:DUF1015 domain-containing protein [Streptomyces sp. NBC_00133]|uniref:DUF1015 family protein n=1 Tax=Streptomyces sp. NBC_00133 TaxID=2903624 RepID=UPI0032512396